jgi:hypothetical protein
MGKRAPRSQEWRMDGREAEAYAGREGIEGDAGYRDSGKF